jgi:hypothetical protein
MAKAKIKGKKEAKKGFFAKLLDSMDKKLKAKSDSCCSCCCDKKK